jgi:hypothetical protein
VTKLFTELSFAIGNEKKLLGRNANFDTSTLQLWGAYEEENGASEGTTAENQGSTPSMEGATAVPSVDPLKREPAVPKHGYSKSHRHDLKQMVINLATTGKAAFPIWMESHSGNASDQKVLPEAAVRIKAFCDQLKEAPSFLYVGDAAMYHNILAHSQTLKWLSRVSENILIGFYFLKNTGSDFSIDEGDDALSDGIRSISI